MPNSAGAPDRAQHLRGLEQLLRRDAATVQAGAADAPLLHHRDAQTGGRAVERGRVPARPTSEHDEIEFLGRGTHPPSSLRADHHLHCEGDEDRESGERGQEQQRPRAHEPTIPGGAFPDALVPQALSAGDHGPSPHRTARARGPPRHGYAFALRRGGLPRRPPRIPRTTHDVAARAQRFIEAARKPVPEGTYAIGAGLLIAGLSAYAFQILSYRELTEAAVQRAQRPVGDGLRRRAGLLPAARAGSRSRRSPTAGRRASAARRS